jgi:zinc/manganese transport system substrate-binding protein
MTLVRTRIAAAALALAVAAILPRPAHALRVVATVPDLAALAKEVSGDKVSVSALALATQDPHFVGAKPNLAIELNRADLLLLVGLDLEVGWLPVLLTGARNPAIQPGARGHLDCSQFVRRLDVPAGPIDRSMGDIHPGGNPHYLVDPRAAAAVSRAIAARLAELDPRNAAAYQAGLGTFLERLEAERTGWERRFAPHRGAPILAYHKTWVYLADWLGLVEVAHLEPKPGIPPNPTHVAQVLEVAKTRGARLLLQEDYYPPSTSKLVASRAGVPFVQVPAATDFARGERYLARLDAVLERILRALEVTEVRP